MKVNIKDRERDERGMVGKSIINGGISFIFEWRDGYKVDSEELRLQVKGVINF